MKAYYHANKEASAKRGAAWRKANPEKVAEYSRRARKKAACVRYGISPEQYDDLMARRCGICGSEVDICIDHCHSRGVVRDALCRKCNSAIGLMDDAPSRLRRAADYIEHHAAKHKEPTQ